MKKIGIFPFILYLLYTLVGGGLAVYCRIAIEQLSDDAGWNGLGLAIVMVVGIIVGAVGLVGVILKGLHLKTEFSLFGILCVLFDIICILALIDSTVGESFVHDIVPALPYLGVMTASAICNLISLKK